MNQQPSEETLQLLRKQVDEAFETARERHPCVYAMQEYLDAGLTEVEALKGVVGILSAINTNMKEQLWTVSGIVPHRYQLPDGRVVRYDVPDRVLPLEKIEHTFKDAFNEQPTL